MKKRHAVQNYLPDAYRLMREIDSLIKTGINPYYFELIKIRASQLNGCAYCINAHINDAMKLGEDLQRLNLLSAWREAENWFNEDEQTIIRLTEEITLIGEHGISDEVYEKAIELFGEEKLSYLIMAAISINSWNRLGVGLRLHPVKYAAK